MSRLPVLVVLPRRLVSDQSHSTFFVCSIKAVDLDLPGAGAVVSIEQPTSGTDMRFSCQAAYSSDGMRTTLPLRETISMASWSLFTRSMSGKSVFRASLALIDLMRAPGKAEWQHHE